MVSPYLVKHVWLGEGGNCPYPLMALAMIPSIVFDDEGCDLVVHWAQLRTGEAHATPESALNW